MFLGSILASVSCVVQRNNLYGLQTKLYGPNPPDSEMLNFLADFPDFGFSNMIFFCHQNQIKYYIITNFQLLTICMYVNFFGVNNFKRN